MSVSRGLLKRFSICLSIFVVALTWQAAHSFFISPLIASFWDPACFFCNQISVSNGMHEIPIFGLSDAFGAIWLKMCPIESVLYWWFILGGAIVSACTAVLWTRAIAMMFQLSPMKEFVTGVVVALSPFLGFYSYIGYGTVPVFFLAMFLCCSIRLSVKYGRGWMLLFGFCSVFAGFCRTNLFALLFLAVFCYIYFVFYMNYNWSIVFVDAITGSALGVLIACTMISMYHNICFVTPITNFIASCMQFCKLLICVFGIAFVGAIIVFLFQHCSTIIHRKFKVFFMFVFYFALAILVIVFPFLYARQKIGNLEDGFFHVTDGCFSRFVHSLSLSDCFFVAMEREYKELLLLCCFCIVLVVVKRFFVEIKQHECSEKHVFATRMLVNLCLAMSMIPLLMFGSFVPLWLLSLMVPCMVAILVGFILSCSCNKTVKIFRLTLLVFINIAISLLVNIYPYVRGGFYALNEGRCKFILLSNKEVRDEYDSVVSVVSRLVDDNDRILEFVPNYFSRLPPASVAAGAKAAIPYWYNLSDADVNSISGILIWSDESKLNGPTTFCYNIVDLPKLEESLIQSGAFTLVFKNENFAFYRKKHQ